MAVRKIIRMGHPALRIPAQPVDKADVGSQALHQLVADMIDTLHDYGGIGLAAPQINEGIRVAIIELPEGATRYGDTARVPLTIFVNPKLTTLGDDTAGFWEGCLSVPGLRGYVERPQHVKVEYTDMQGHGHEIEMKGFAATVVQHEFDHLDGRLYIDHITDPTKLAFEEEFERYVLSGH